MPNDTLIAQREARAREEAMTGQMYFSSDFAHALMDQIPKYKLFIFNVGPLEHTVTKGSAGPPGGYKIPACPKGEKYWGPLIVPSIVIDTYMVENEMKAHTVTGEFMCQDIVHPYIGKNWSFGQNLDELGVFWTKNNPPTEEDLQKAHLMLEKTFRQALMEATQLEATGNLVSITPMMRHAADYFEEDRPWNKIYRKTAACPGCGGAANFQFAVHSCGAVLNWHKAIALGLRTPEQAKIAGVELNGQSGQLRGLEIPDDESVSPEFAAAVLEQEERDLKELDARSPKQPAATAPPVQAPARPKKKRR